jgi:hypothetical protein
MVSKAKLRRARKVNLVALCRAKGIPVCRDFTKADLVDLLLDRQDRDRDEASRQREFEAAAWRAAALEPLAYRAVVRCPALGALPLYVAEGATRQEATHKAEAWLSFARAASRGVLVGAWVDGPALGLTGPLAA